MWFFDDNEVTGRNLSKRKGRRRSGSANLKVKMRTSLSSKNGMQHASLFVFSILALVAIVVLGYMGIQFTGRVLFSENDDFIIAPGKLKIKTEASAVLSRDLIMEYTEINEGMNMFDVDIKQVRENFLSRSPNVREMEITRILPDTLKINIMERIPIARVGRKGDLVLDSQGWIFVRRSASKKLPTISGYRGVRLQPGVKTDGMILAALQLIDVCRDPRYGVRIDSISVSPDDYMIIYMPKGSALEEVKFNWAGMGEGGKESKDAMITRIDYVVQIMRKNPSQKKLDATHEDALYGS